MGHGRFVEWPAAELVDVGVQARRDSADLVFAEPGHTHLLGYVLDFPGSGAGGVHLRDRDHERAVDPLVALDHVVREEAPGPEFRDAEREGSTHVAGDLSRCPLRLLAPPPQSRSASASITALTTCSASLRRSSCMSMALPSKRGVASMSGVGSAKIPLRSSSFPRTCPVVISESKTRVVSR